MGLTTEMLEEAVQDCHGLVAAEVRGRWIHMSHMHQCLALRGLSFDSIQIVLAHLFSNIAYIARCRPDEYDDLVHEIFSYDYAVTSDDYVEIYWPSIDLRPTELDDEIE